MYDLVIIGGGPAGLSAGIYAARANLKTAIVEKGLPGGQMQNTTEVENYPGVGIVLGAELSQKMHEQAVNSGVEWKQGEVNSLSYDQEEKVVDLGSEQLKARAVLIAVGAQPRYLGVPGEREFAGRGVSYCATCDGAFFRGKNVVVVGGGDSALEEGLFLARLAAQVTVVHRRDKLRAQPVFQERAFANPKMKFVWNSTVEEILGDGRVTGVRLFNRETQQSQEMDTDGVFIYIGFDPNTGFLAGAPFLNAEGYVVTDGSMATSIPGIFAAGDVRETKVRQIITAAADGAVAAMSAYAYLEN